MAQQTAQTTKTCYKLVECVSVCEFCKVGAVGVVVGGGMLHNSTKKIKSIIFLASTER